MYHYGKKIKELKILIENLPRNRRGLDAVSYNWHFQVHFKIDLLFYTSEYLNINVWHDARKRLKARLK
jgi:hypothetical protein